MPKMLFLILAGTILILLSGVPTQAEQPRQVDRPGKTTSRLSGSRAAGAYWAAPWQEGGPKILDTRRSAPPARQVTPLPAPDSHPGPARYRPSLTVDLYARDRWTPEYYGYRQFYPFLLPGFKSFDRQRLAGGFPAGRGYISAGRGFRGVRPGFHGRGFKGRGFRGGVFRGR